MSILETIAENLTAMGYGAKVYEREPSEGKEGAQRVYFNTSKDTYAYIDMSKGAPAFKVWCDFKEGYTPKGGDPLTGHALKAHSAKVAGYLRNDLTGAAAVATLAALSMEAEPGGPEVLALADGFGALNRGKYYGPEKPKAEAEADTEATARAPRSKPAAALKPGA